jgi:predicted phosphodiesterase
VPPGDPDALIIAARHMDVDVLLWGGTHRFEAYDLEGKFFINPGSATGAMSTGWWAEGEEPIPSFCLMDVSNLSLLGRPGSDTALSLMLTDHWGLGTRGCACAICLSAQD